MKKILVLLLLFGMLASGCTGEDTAALKQGEEIAAWNLDEMIHPQLKEEFMKLPEMVLTRDSLAEARKAVTPSPESLPKNERIEVYDEIIGNGLRVQVYKPKTEQKEYPALLWLHGGGHIVGTPEGNMYFALGVADELSCIVVVPDYRLAPEHPYPADVEDCYSALVWMTENLPVRKDRVAVAGNSAGGGLTAAVALMARDKKYPAICFQMPLYPMLDYRNTTPSSYQIRDHRVWCRDFNILSWECYLGGISGDVPAYASPAMAEDLSGLPPAYIMVGQLDPFRDESITYAQRMLEAGVPVELHVIPGVTHGFEGIFNAEISTKTLTEYVNALAEALK